jgi:hypothetical protein
MVAMSPNVQFEQVKPGVEVVGDAVQRPWVIVLSDWAASNEHEEQFSDLARRIDGLFERAGPRAELPLVLVVDDMYHHGWIESRLRLVAALAEAGAFIIEPDGEAEVQAVENDPLGFADEQLRAAMIVVQPPGAPPAPAHVTEPNGYKEFEKPFTRLTPEELADVIEGRRRDDDQWRYEW